MASQARILLTNPRQGYLDIKEGTSFPINFSLGDIRDISKKNGSFSRTITIVGNKESNKILGYLYDVNIQQETFNINTLQECLVEQDGIVILDNMYLQLTDVNKVQKPGSHDYDVEYEAEIRDSSADFFSKISNLELTDLDLSEFNNHNYTVQSITASFDNTYVDGYKYIVPWKNPFLSLTASQTYELNEMRPAIYARQYWDKIFNAAGYTYEFSEKDNFEIQFDKLIIPYNGEDVKVSDDSDLVVEAEISGTFSLSNTYVTYDGSTPTARTKLGPSYNTSGYDASIILDNEISDNNNQYNPATGVFQPSFSITNPATLKFQFSVSYELHINLPTDATLSKINPSSSNNGLKLGPGLTLRNNTNQTATIKHFPTFNIPIGTTYSAGSTQLFSGSTNFELAFSTIYPSAQFVEKIRMYADYITAGDVLGWKNGSTYYQATYTVKVTSINMRIVPENLSLGYNIPVDINQFIPKKVKQSEFIKSIAQMYNLFISIDRDDKTKLIVKTRDQFYDEGVVRDWTNKLAKDQIQDIKFLPELSNKKLILSYKPDNDVANKGYLDNVKEVYGQIEYVFENEYVKGVDRKELLFSPTPNDITSFEANTPIIDGFAPKNNIRILLDNGSRSCNTYTIRQNGSGVSVTNYPYVSHFNDDLNPTFDINYGICDYYFYNVETTTDNNLYNLHWRRTLGQINNGKLLTAYFNLNNVDIQKLKLNDKIRIDNSYWNINKVIDYNANSNNLTQVELISIDDELELPAIKTKVIKRPNKGDSPLRDVVIAPNISGPVRPGGLNGVLSPNVDVKGTNNFVDNTKGYIIGDDNTVSTDGENVRVNGDNNMVNSGSDVFGDNNIVEPDSRGVVIVGDGNTIPAGSTNVFILGDNITATESNTFYTTNVNISGNINGVPVSSIISSSNGDFCTTGITSSVVRACGPDNSLDLDASNANAILLQRDGYSSYLYSDNISGIQLFNKGLTTSFTVASQMISMNYDETSTFDGGIYQMLLGVRQNSGGQSQHFNGIVIGNTKYYDTKSPMLGTGLSSVIINSLNSKINNLVKNSVIIGGSGLTSSQDDTVYVPYLNLGYVPVSNPTASQILVRNSSTGDVEYRDVSTISGTPPSLSTVLSTGNVSGGNNMILTDNDFISNTAGNSYMTFTDFGVPGNPGYGAISLGTLNTGFISIDPDGNEVIQLNMSDTSNPSILGQVLVGSGQIKMKVDDGAQLSEILVEEDKIILNSSNIILSTPPPTNNSNTEILTRNVSTGDIELRDASTIVTRTIGTYSTTSNITTDVALAYTNTSSFTLYLPTAVGITGSEYTIKDRDGNANTNNIIISGTLSQLIDGSSTYTMRLNYESITLISDGQSWWII